MKPKVKEAIKALREWRDNSNYTSHLFCIEADRVCNYAEDAEKEIDRLRGLLADIVKADWHLRIEQYKFRAGFGVNHGEIAAMEMQRDEAVERILKGEV